MYLIYILKMKEIFNLDLVVFEMYDERMKEINYFWCLILLILRDSYFGKIKNNKILKL